MQVLLNADPHIDGRHHMAQYLETVVKETLGHFGERITRVEAHLADAKSHAKAAPDDIHCTLEARLKGLEPLVVKEQAGNAHQAIHGALSKLKRAVTTTLEKHDSHRHATLPSEAQAEAEPDDTAGLPG